MFKHQMPIEVRWGDMDAYGHVNNTLYFRYFEMARFRYFEALNIYHDGKLPTVVLAKIDCQFKHPLFYPASIIVTSRVNRLGNSSFEMQASIYQGDTECAHSVSTMVWVNPSTHRPEKIPTTVREKIIYYEGLDEALNS